jgi:hypothetical protein
VARKIGRTTNFFSPLSFAAVFGSEILDPDGQKSGSGIWDKHPGSATLVLREMSKNKCFFYYISFNFFSLV